MAMFSLFYPVKPILVNQAFGNPDPKYTSLGLKGHNGIDFHACNGGRITAAHNGFCSREIVDVYGGHGVEVTSIDSFYYNGVPAFFKTVYWHLIPGTAYKARQKVFVGDLIGLADNTGFSTGDHLHFGLKPQFPPGINIEQSNGYNGAIDPRPYFNGEYAEDIAKQMLIIQKAKQVISLLKQLLGIT